MPKFTVVGVTANWPGLAPAPDNATLRLLTEPSAVSARLPLAFPLLWGVNVTLKVRLWPAFKVVGTLKPLVANPAPVTVAVERCSNDPPVFVRICECDWVLPTCTVPKAMLVGFAARAPGVRPVPESGMLKEELLALLVMAMLPVALPAALGANVAVKDALCPAFRVAGRLRPLMLKPVPLADACVMVIAELLPLFSVMVCG